MTAVLAMLSFLTPWWAAGAVAAVGLPLLAHLLSKTRYREVMFPATRFVKQAVQQTSRIERPRHRLLMLLRWLLLLLVVIAFMRPRWLPQAEARDSEQGVALIVLLDASASMRRIADGATLYERAVRQADAMLATLDPTRDVAAIVRVDRRSHALLPEATADFSLLRAALASTTPTFESANWSAAMTSAQQLSEQAGRRTRIVVISDQQGDGPIRDLHAFSHTYATMHQVRIDAPSDNTAVRLIDIGPYPPIAGRPVNVIGEVAHFGESSADVQLRASLGGSQAQRSLTLAPGATQRVTFTLAADSPGPAVLRLQLAERDALPFDDATGQVLDIQAQSDVLIIHDNDVAARQLAERLGVVLNPGEEASAGLPRISTTSIDQALVQVQQADPAQLRTIVLLHPQQLSAELGEALTTYTRRGGGLIVFVSDVRRIDTQNTLRLPLMQGDNLSDMAIDSPAKQIDFSLEPLRVFEGPARAGLASLIWPGIDPAMVEPDTQTILSAGNDWPIVVSKTIGRGRLVAINTDLTPGPGGLLAEPAFVVLLNELCRYASPGPALPTPLHPGDPIPVVIRNAASIKWPDDADAAASILTAPGAYLAVDPQSQLAAGVWVELDAAESDTRLGDNWSDDDATSTASHDTTRPATAAAIATSRIPPIELWPYFIVGVMLLAACESLLLWRFASNQGGA